MRADIEQWLQEGIAAVKAGRDATGRELLARVVDQDPYNETAWLWLASVAESDAELRLCLENVLEINPANDAVRARLALLDSVAVTAPAVEPAPPPAETVAPAPAPPPAEMIAAESEEGCPYCGQEIDPDNRTCPHCHGRLVFEKPRNAAAGRVWLLAFSWVLLAIAYLMSDVLIAVGLVNWATRESGARFALFSEYLTSYVVNLSADIPPQMYGPLLRVLVGAEIIAILWCLVMAAITPARRHGVIPVAGFIVLPFTLVLMLAETAAGLYVSLLKLVATITVGVFVFTGIDDFTWEKVRYTLGLERGLKTALDFYNRGRRYREMGMLANAVLHWERAALLAPDQTAFRIPLINALYKLGRYAEASEHIRTALGQLPPASPQAQELQQFLEHIRSMEVK